MSFLTVLYHRAACPDKTNGSSRTQNLDTAVQIALFIYQWISQLDIHKLYKVEFRRPYNLWFAPIKANVPISFLVKCTENKKSNIHLYFSVCIVMKNNNETYSFLNLHELHNKKVLKIMSIPFDISLGGKFIPYSVQSRYS